jgi:CBS domain containing-hemolysin-like protein
VAWQWWQVLLVAGGIMTVFLCGGVVKPTVGGNPKRPRNGPEFRGLARAIRVVVGPLAEGLIVLGNIVTPGRGVSATLTSEDQFRNWVDEAAEQDMLEAEDRELIHSVFEFGDTIVREVMVARTDMVTVDADDTVHDVMGVFLDKRVSRIPVIGKDSDEVIGICYLRDVARVEHEKPAAKKTTIARLQNQRCLFPRARKQMTRFVFAARAQNHLAMVVDEYGGIAGLVTSRRFDRRTCW